MTSGNLNHNSARAVENVRTAPDAPCGEEWLKDESHWINQIDAADAEAIINCARALRISPEEAEQVLLGA